MGRYALLYIFFRRSAAGCFTPSGRPPSVLLCFLVRNYIREGASRISLVVALAVAARSSIGESTGGGQGACAIVA